MDEHRHLSRTVILISNDGMGQGPAELRHKLLKSYFTMLLECPEMAGAICFYTEGVKLVLEESPVLDELRQLESQGVLLISCATSLNHYGAADRVAVGILGGMRDIMAAQTEGGKVISL
jgi:hypothetical protein